MKDINNIIQLTINKNLSIYITFKLEVQRGIKGKTRSKVDELLIVGIPTTKVRNYCIKNDLIITNKAVYYQNLDNPILKRLNNSFTYTK